MFLIISNCTCSFLTSDFVVNNATVNVLGAVLPTFKLKMIFGNTAEGVINAIHFH